MALHIERFGQPRRDTDRVAKATTALVHGFTQNANCWGPFANGLAADGPLLAIDLPGHGRSAHDDADLPTAAELTSAAIAYAGGASTWIGYSMGGRVLLHAALAAPASIGRLVLIGATPGIINKADRSKRQSVDNRLADRLLADGLDSFLDFWLDLPLFANLSPAASARTSRQTNRPEGLAASLRNCGTGTQAPLWDRLGELSMPVLIIAGDHDKKFCTIGRDMALAIGANADFVVIEGAGHACHLEDPAATAAVITAV